MPASVARDPDRMSTINLLTPSVSSTHDIEILFTRSGRQSTVLLFDYLSPEQAEGAERGANAWIKSLRQVPFDGRSFRDAFSYRGDSLWWFAELYLHKQRTINRALAARRALEALIDRERPERIALVNGDHVVDLVVRALAARRGLTVDPSGAPDRTRWLAHAKSSIAPRVYALTPLLNRLRRSARATPTGRPAGVDVAVFVHSAFWRAETGEDTYVGPLVNAMQSHFGARLEIISVGPSTTFRSRTWTTRAADLWRGSPADVGESRRRLTPIETFSSMAALSGSRQFWRERRQLTHQLLSNDALRRASIVDDVDLWPVLRADFVGIARLQLPWSVRAMDEAASALDVLRPRVIVTYAEAGGWGRALVLEARRRGIASVGLQHGFISRHWLNYLHEPDEMQPRAAPLADAGFPLPTVTLLFDEFAREHLESRGRFPSKALRVIGNPRLERLASAARRLTSDDQRRVREAAGVRSDQHLVLLAIKYRPAWNETLRALVEAIAAMPQLHLAIRPHPGDAPTSYDALVTSVPNARIVPRSLDAVALLTSARLVVTINSTVAIEAMALGTPALAMRLPNYLTPFVDAGAMAGTRATSEIGPAIAELVADGDIRNALLENARRFLERYRIPPDGRSAERAIELVEELNRRAT